MTTERRPLSAQVRIFRRRAALVVLSVAVAGGAAYAVLSLTEESENVPPPVPAGPPGEGGRGQGGGDVASTHASTSAARLPALSLDAPPGWKLEVDPAGNKLTVTSSEARLRVSSAVLTEAVDVAAMLRQLAETQRALGFEVGDTFSDRIGDLPAAGFLATGPGRSICTFMVKRDARLATSLICTAEGKASAREACRPVLANIRWRAPAR